MSEIIKAIEKAIEWFNGIGASRRFAICIVLSIVIIILCEIYYSYKQRARK